MTNIKSIAENLALNYTVRGEIFLFLAHDAIKLINELERLQIKILGIDAFILGKRSIQPVMEHGADFSQNGTSILGCWHDAKELIKSKADLGFFFEIVA